VIKHVRLNTMDKYVWRTFTWDDVEAAARNHLLVGQLKHLSRENIASSKITKQPGINVQFGEGCLNPSWIKHGNHSVTAGAYCDTRIFEANK